MVKKVLRFLVKAVKWFFIVVLVFAASLFFREQSLPRSWVDAIAERCSSESCVVRCDGAAFGFRDGLRLLGVRLYDSSSPGGMEPFFSARSVAVDPMTRVVRVAEAKYPRLPDFYYSEECRERNERVEVEFPNVPEFRLVLEQPKILGLEPSRVTAQVNVRRKWVTLDDIAVHLPWKGRAFKVDGSFRLDIAGQTAYWDIRGEAMPEQIRPLIVALDVPSALPYMDAFTEVSAPVPARGEFEINLVNGDFTMVLDLKPPMCRYRGVAMSRVEGVLDLEARTRGTNCNVRLKAGIPLAIDREGAKMSGGVQLDLVEGLPRLALDVRSELSLADALTVADFLSPDALDVVSCDTKPVVTAKGVCGTSAEDAAYNDVSFTARLERGSFMGLRLNDALAEFRVSGETLDFTRIEARGKSGGRYAATARLEFPGYDEDRMSFSAKARLDGGTLDEVADFLGFEVGDRDGAVTGWCEFDGPLGTNALEKLCGKGSFAVREGHIAQLNLFAGLTKMLADYVPGVSYIVNQSDASADFAVTNGVLTTENLYIEGGLVSLKGWGSYDIAHDKLDLTVRVQFLKKESLMGKLVHPVTWPFTKLLLEFRAKGRIGDPEWDYISILDRIL